MVDAIERDFRKADITQRDLAMLDYAENLTRDPCNMTKNDFAKLRESGFEDPDILDIVQIISYYNYVNRLGCGLGVELEEYWGSE